VGSYRFLSLLLVSLFSCAATLDPIQYVYTDDVNGVATNDHPAVGEIFWKNHYSCNVVLISPEQALTAYHCIDDWDEHNFEHATIVFGGKQYAVKAASAVSFLPDTGATDLASITLTHSVPGIRPMKISLTDPLYGDNLVFVGRGCSSYESYKWGATPRPVGTKRAKYFTFRDYVMDYNYFPQEDLRICPGDSGGALIRLSDYSLVGIASAKIYRPKKCGNPGEGEYIAAMFADPKLFLNLLGRDRILRERSFLYLGVK
jgi:hypothetical protein